MLKDEQAPHAFRWTTTLGSHLKLSGKNRPGGQIDYVDQNGDAALRIEPAWAIDAHGTKRDVHTEVVDGELRLEFDPKGLAYPIAIDPVVSVPVWGGIDSVGGGGRTGSTLTYIAGGPVLFGGTSDYTGGVMRTTTDRWDGSVWTSLTPPAVAPVAAHAAASWKGNLVYFGGCNGALCANELGSAAYFTGTAWGPFCSIPPAVNCGIPARSGHSMAATSTQLVVFGGVAKADTPPHAVTYFADGTDSYGYAAADLWVLDSSSSTNAFVKTTVAGDKPMIRDSAAFAGSASEIILFGGYNTTFGYLFDTWRYNPGPKSWTKVCPSPTCAEHPSGRSGAGMVYDSARKKYVLFGGSSFDGTHFGSNQETWEFDSTTVKWTLLCGTSAGAAMNCGIGLDNDSPPMAYDPVRKRIVQATGYSGGYRDYAYELYVRGATCTSPADCDALGSGGVCIEGTCCESDCGTCKTCVDPTSPGVCKNVVSGLADPRGRCAASTLCNGAGACKATDGSACASGSTCSSTFCVNATCCEQASCAPGLTCATSDGSCKKLAGQLCSATTDCASGFCVNGYCCGSSCSAGQRCDFTSAPGSCKKINGQTCAAGAECGSGTCTDGVCCNTACGGQCQACDVSGSIGTCVTVAGAPHGSRATCSGSGACGSTCSGTNATACVYPGSATACGSASCSAGISTLGGTCNGSGTCAQPTDTCDPYVCGAAACKTTCASSADCRSDHYCTTGSKCVPKAANGDACSVGSSCTSGNCAGGVCCDSACGASGFSCNLPTSRGHCAKANAVACASSSECGSGFCVDGLCCGSKCDGQCQACDVAGSVGTCTAVKGAPHGTRSACTGAGADACSASCDGVTTAACKYPTATTSCGAATCLAGTETHTSVCNGTGSCADTPKACTSYLCGPTACKSSCTAKSDCSDGYYCKSNACIPIEGLGTSCTDAAACPSGFCVDGVCCGVASCGAGKSCSAGSVKGVCSGLNGTVCSTNSQCASGACVDGVCCDGACNGSCEACNLPGSIGKCAAVVGNPLAGHPACSATPTDATCGLRCNGVDSKKCAYAPVSTSCGTPGCGGGVETPVSTCDGGGLCKASSKSCGAYACDATSCRTTCALGSDCATGYFCKAGACVGKQALGESCADVDQCASGFCTDGVCCSVTTCGDAAACSGPGDRAGTCLKKNGATCVDKAECAAGHCVDGLCCDKGCDGQCEACDVKGSEGTCTPSTGVPHGARTACDTLADDDCAKSTCNGETRDKCSGFANGATTACGKDVCTSEKKLQKHGGCDGKGGCALPDPSSCVEYACDDATTSCRTSCTTDDQCGTDYKCDVASGKCIQGAHCSEDGIESIDKTGKSTTCAPYRCATDGTCIRACGTSDDCVPGAVCDATTRACVGTAAPVDEGGGCAVSSNGGKRASFGAAALFVAALIQSLRRRRQNRV